MGLGAGPNFVVMHMSGAPQDHLMQTVDALISLIRANREREALELLSAFPELAAGHSEQEGQLHGATPLHWAAHRNAVQLCERLVELGADINDSATSWWRTPLAWAADAGSAGAVELLLNRGADVNQNAVAGTTPLHAVAMGGVLPAGAAIQRHIAKLQRSSSPTGLTLIGARSEIAGKRPWMMRWRTRTRRSPRSYESTAVGI